MEALIGSLKKGLVEVSFTKMNGELRVMNCTIQESYLPIQTDITEVIQTKSKSNNVLAVWDVDNNGWRSFRKDSILDWREL